MIEFTKIKDNVMVEATFTRFGREVKMKGGAKFMMSKLQEFIVKANEKLAQDQAELSELQDTLSAIQSNEDVKNLK